MRVSMITIIASLSGLFLLGLALLTWGLHAALKRHYQGVRVSRIMLRVERIDQLLISLSLAVGLLRLPLTQQLWLAGGLFVVGVLLALLVMRGPLRRLAATTKGIQMQSSAPKGTKRDGNSSCHPTSRAGHNPYRYLYSVYHSCNEDIYKMKRQRKPGRNKERF